MVTVLEALRASRESINGRSIPYQFDRWSSCTCGHIYVGAGGAYESADGRADYASGCGLRALDPTYHAALRAVALAAPPHYLERACLRLDGQATGVFHRMALIVSNLTEVTAEFEGRQRRNAALVMLDRAIAREERIHEEARLAVVAEAERAASAGELALA